jgi:anti-repressor protein
MTARCTICGRKWIIAVEQDKPKVLFAEAVSASDSSILIGELAKLLKQNGIDIGQNRLFEWLRNNGYLIKNGERRNMPTQKKHGFRAF